MSIFPHKNRSKRYYNNSTQEWLPIETVTNGLIHLKDSRYIKLLEILPVNFYLKSDIEQDNIIAYFASYLKIAPDNMQIRIVTERANIEEYISRHADYAEYEANEQTKNMIYNEIEFVKALSNNVAVKKRFFIIFEYAAKPMTDQSMRFSDIQRILSDEAYKAQRYLSQCELGVVDINDNGHLIDILYGFINKHSSKYFSPGNYVNGMLDEVHSYEGGKENEYQ